MTADQPSPSTGKREFCFGLSSSSLPPPAPAEAPPAAPDEYEDEDVKRIDFAEVEEDLDGF